MKKFIWLFGENLGNTYNNNSYYFWDEVCNVKMKLTSILYYPEISKT